MSYRIFSKVLFSCFFLASCSSGNSITPSSVPSQNKKAESQKDFKFESQDPAALVRLAKGFKQSGDIVSALNLYGKASVVNPKLLEPWLGIIRLLQEINNPAGARKAIEDAQKYHPHDPDIAIIAAEIEIADDKATDAITILAPYMDRSDYRISNLLGVISDMLGSPSVARNYYATASRYNPNAARITDNLALSFSFYNDHKAAISILQKNLTNAQKRKASIETLAIIYAMDNQLDAALSLARSVLTDEEAADSFSFYQALHKLPPKIRARAVFTRNIPVDAMPYLQENKQMVEKTAKPQELSKEDMARELVIQRAKKSSAITETPMSVLKAEVPNITVNKKSQNIETKQKTALTKRDLQLSRPQSDEQQAAQPDKTILQEEFLSATPLKDFPQESLDEDKQLPLIEKKETAFQVKVVEKKFQEQQGVTSKMSNEKDIAPQDKAIEARKAYRVQIAAFTNMLSAQTEWCRIAKRVIAAEVHELPNVRIFGEGDDTRYRLLLGEYDDRAEANVTCDALKSKKVGCYVVKGAGKLRPLESDCKR